MVLSFLATDWNKERFPPSPDLVVLETKPGIPQDTWILLSPRADRRTRSKPTPRFIGEISCVSACDPEWRNGIGFGSTPVAFENVRKAVTVIDPKKEVVIKPKNVDETYDYPSTNYSLDELGHALLPAHTYAVRIDPSLTGVKQWLAPLSLGRLMRSCRSCAKPSSSSRRRTRRNRPAR